MKKRVLSAIQPTGEIHYGNYFGAIKNWIALQEKYECIFGVVDYHSMTMPYKPDKLRQNTWDLLFNLMAMGIKPENLFIQSLVPEHTELNWILNCFASYGQLTRMTQFKDKSAKNIDSGEQFISAGLLDYPVLQAADILIYKADFVPVGKDQNQHLELTRNIAQRFNNQMGKAYFVLPETLHTETPKICSTADPTRKMSKSAGVKHYISCFGDEQRLRKQIKSAVTDDGTTPKGELSAGVGNLLELLKGCDKHDVANELTKSYHEGTLKYVDLKNEVADALWALSSQFIENKKEILANKKEYKYKIKQSSANIRKIAQETIKEVKDLTGLINVRF